MGCVCVCVCVSYNHTSRKKKYTQTIHKPVLILLCLTGLVGGGDAGFFDDSDLESCLWMGTWFLVLLLQVTMVPVRDGASVGTTVVMVAAFVVVGHGMSKSPFSRASSVFVDLSAMVHLTGRAGTSLKQRIFVTFY